MNSIAHRLRSLRDRLKGRAAGHELDEIAQLAEEVERLERYFGRGETPYIPVLNPSRAEA